MLGNVAAVVCGDNGERGIPPLSSPPAAQWGRSGGPGTEEEEEATS